MDKIKDGGTAFPVNDSASVHAVAFAAIARISDPGERDRIYTEEAGRAAGGMKLRDYFAAKAMQALLTGTDSYEVSAGRTVEEQVALDAYQYADAMLRARGAA